MSIAIHREYTVRRPADAVIAFLAQHGNELRWNDEMRGIERLDAGALGVGARFRDTARVMGRTVRVEIELVEYDPHRRVRYRGMTSAMSLHTTYDATPAETGCVVSFHFEATLRGAARLAPAVVRRLMARRFDRILPRAWLIVERETA